MKKFTLISSIIACILLATLLTVFFMVRKRDDTQHLRPLVKSRPMRINPYLEKVHIEINSVSDSELIFTIYNESEHGILIDFDARTNGWRRIRAFDNIPGNITNIQMYEDGYWWITAPRVFREDQNVVWDMSLPAELYIYSGSSMQITWNNMNQSGSLFRCGNLYRITVEVIQAVYYATCGSCPVAKERGRCCPVIAFGVYPDLTLIRIPPQWDHLYFHDLVAEFYW